MENKKVFSRIGFGLVVLIVLSIITSAILPNAIPAIFKGSVGGILANYVGMYVIGLPLLLWMIRKFPKQSIEKKQSASFKEMVQLYILALSGMYSVNLIFTLVMQLFTEGNSNVIGETISQMSIFQTALLVVIFAPIIEELIFRKLLYQLVAPFGAKTYIFTSAMIFGLFHMNLSQSLYAFWLGLIFAGLFYKTGNILYPILLHMVINFTGSIVPLLLGENSTASIIFSVWLLIVIVLGLIFCFLFRKKIKKQAPKSVAKQAIPFKTIFLNPGMSLYVLLCVLAILMVLISQLAV